VPTESGVQQWALFKKGRESSQFIDPANPESGPQEWVGQWRALEPATNLDLTCRNFSEAWDKIKFPRLFFNTLAIAIIGITGTLISSVSVAYAFARFPIPGKNFLFIIIIGTIILPGQVTLVPILCLFCKHWLDGNLAAADRPAFLCQRLRCVLATPVLCQVDPTPKGGGLQL